MNLNKTYIASIGFSCLLDALYWNCILSFMHLPVSAFLDMATKFFWKYIQMHYAFWLGIYCWRTRGIYCWRTVDSDTIFLGFSMIGFSFIVCFKVNFRFRNKNLKFENSLFINSFFSFSLSQLFTDVRLPQRLLDEWEENDQQQ